SQSVEQPIVNPDSVASESTATVSKSNGGFGFKKNANIKMESNENKPPIPKGNFGWGTREFPPKK
ncbi:hypothetical protein, partial [Vibrio anguillarum]|uniref:hypothetical protein n=1 Tax=Vibrio anguillarum TaxID=55601 RepID=UPI00188D59A8